MLLVVGDEALHPKGNLRLTTASHLQNLDFKVINREERVYADFHNGAGTGSKQYSSLVFPKPETGPLQRAESTSRWLPLAGSGSCLFKLNPKP